jgi:hypothetical protein
MLGINPILAFSTSNYDAMLKFLLDFGFVLKGGEDQLCPLFNQRRAARLGYDDFEFNLEESSLAKASFSLLFTDFPDDRLERLKTTGYKFEYGAGLHGECHSFKSPDGGIFAVT